MLAQKLIVSYGSKISVQFIQITASIIVARVAGPAVLGTVAYGLAFVSLFLFISDLGIGTAHTKLISEGEDLGRCIGTFSKIKSALIALFFFVVLGIYFGQKYLFDIEFESLEHEYVILILLVALAIEQILFIPKTTFVAKTEQAKADLPQLTGNIIHHALRVVIVILGYRAVMLAFGHLLSILVIIPFVYFLYKDYPRSSFDKELAKRYLKISIPVVIIGLSTNAMGNIDRIFLQHLTQSEQVGFYSAGYRIGSLVVMVANSVGLLFFPYFSKAASNGDIEFIKSKVEKFERFSFVFIMPPVIFLSLYSDVIIKVLLGNEYLPSVPVMTIVNLAMFLSILNVSYGNVLMGMGFFKMVAWINLANLFIFTTLLFVLISPRLFDLEADGAALAVFSSHFFIGILLRIFAKRKCKILDILSGGKYLIFGVVNFLFFYFLYSRISILNGPSIRLVFIPVYFGCTYLALAMLGWIGREDWRAVRVLTDLKKLRKYIREEIGKKRQ